MRIWSLAISLACVFALISMGNARAETNPPQHPAAISLRDMKGTSGIGLSESAFLLEDPSGKITVDELVRKGFSEFAPIERFSLQPGYTSSRFWIWLTLRNTSSTSDWFIVPDYPMLEFEAYELRTDGTYQKTLVHPFETRFPIRHLKFQAGEEKHLLLEIWSPLVVNLQFKLLDPKQLRSRNTSENILLGLISGVFFAMIVYNIFLYVNLRDKDYLYYLFFAIVNTHMNLLSANYPEGIFHWFGIPWWSVIDVYRPLCPLSTLLFARSFLQTKAEHPILDGLIRIYNVGLVICMGLAFFVPRHTLFAWEDNYFLIAIGLLLAAGVASLRRGFRPSHYYLVGLGFFVVGIGIYLTRCEGLLPTNAFTLNAHLSFQAVEMLLMSLALSGKIKELETSKTSAEATARVKGRLLRVLSHDIANPLSIVKGTAYIMKKDSTQVSRADAITRAVGVIEEIMQFVRKTESLDDKKKIAVEFLPVAEVFDSLQFVFQKLAEEKNLSISFELDNPSLHVRAEKTSLTYEVLGNFLANAIKFSEAGGEIKVRAVHIGKRTQISIADQGVGMSAEAVRSAFDPSINVSRRGTAGEKGGGFGLLLAKAYLDQYGATIAIESSTSEENPGRSGTKITLSFVGMVQTKSARTDRQRWRLLP